MIPDSIHAFVRIRPDKGEKSVMLENDTSVYLVKTNEKFEFGTIKHDTEYAFSEEATNQEVY